MTALVARQRRAALPRRSSPRTASRPLADAPRSRTTSPRRTRRSSQRRPRAAGATWLVAAATAYGKDLLPRAAVPSGAAVATDVLAFAGEGADILLRRPMWAGNVIAEVELGRR